MGRWHAEYSTRAGGEVVALVDPEPSSTAALGRRFPTAQRYGDDAEWLNAAGADVVHVCTPTPSHVALASQALAAGCHVLVEKPLAPSHDECARLLETAAAQGLRLAAVHQFPFQRGVRELCRRSRRLGRVVEVTHRIHSAGGDDLDPDARRRTLVEMLPHAVSLFHALGLETPARAWTVLRSDADRLDLAAAADSAQLRVAFSLTSRPTRNELVVAGSEATATADLFHGFVTWERGRVTRRDKILLPFRRATDQLGRAGINLLWRAVRRQPAYPGLPELIAAFYQSFDGAREPAVSPAEILSASTLQDLVAEA